MGVVLDRLCVRAVTRRSSEGHTSSSASALGNDEALATPVGSLIRSPPRQELEWDRRYGPLSRRRDSAGRPRGSHCPFTDSARAELETLPYARHRPLARVPDLRGASGRASRTPTRAATCRPSRSRIRSGALGATLAPRGRSLILEAHARELPGADLRGNAHGERCSPSGA
jgi:hypothetical protein